MNPEPNHMEGPPSGGDHQPRYQIVAQVGQGGMSLIHLAAVRGAHGIQKLVVLKSMRPELLQDQKMRRMFLDEGRRATLLNHANIVQTYEVVTIDSRPVMVMEYMEGQALSKVLKHLSAGPENKRMSLGAHLRILQDALIGLDYAHNLVDYAGKSLGLVHRDVSPQNVFVTYDGHVKILDFGIAKAVDGSHHTEIGEIKGKIRYMAPEQMHGAPDVDRRADIFGMGAMLWEALTGKRLWQGVPDTKVINTVLNDGVPAPSTERDGIHPELEAICMKALARERNDRYESAGQMQAELERVADSLGLRASHKDIGRIVQDLFGEERGKVRQAIEAKLSSQEPAIFELPVDEAGMELLTGQARSGTPSALGVTQLEPRNRLGLWVAFLGLLLACAALFFAFQGRTPPPSPAPVAATKPPPTPPTPSADADTVTVHFVASPPNAQLFMDGVLLPSNPYDGKSKTDSKPHELRAEAAGFDTKTVEFSLAGPADASLSLEASSKSSSKAGKHAVGSMRPLPVLPHPTTAKPDAPNCASPFSVDANGIRRVRPECM